MRILVIGGGGREHAIVEALARSRHEPEIFCAPGNGGTAELAQNLALDIEDPADVLDWIERTGTRIDLVVVGPEAPLVAGIANLCAAHGIPCFGPPASGAQLEGSKWFAKELMTRHGIPTAPARLAELEDEAVAIIEEHGAPLVVKADGLAAGKGVLVASSEAEARAFAHECFTGGFGDAGLMVLIEDRLEGEECSLLAFADGETVLPMVPAQDHKRVNDGDEGPNTGGMGAYSPVPSVDAETHAAMLDILKRTVDAMRAEGIRYRGVLYGGFMLTSEGPKVLEFNVRFGDPEAQVVLPRLKTDLVDVMLATVEGRLHEIELEWTDDAAVCVVLASGGYPGEYEKGKVITGIEDAKAVPGVHVYHAGTKREADGTLVTAGGRVLAVTALGPTIREARERAYEAVGRISFEGAHHRTDIGLKALRALGEA